MLSLSRGLRAAKLARVRCVAHGYSTTVDALDSEHQPQPEKKPAFEQRKHDRTRHRQQGGFVDMVRVVVRGGRGGFGSMSWGRMC